MTANEVLAPVEALAGNRETGGGNNTLVNSHYGAPGQAYCGYTVRYGFEMSGNSAAIASCPSVIWVPSFRAWASEHWERIDNAKAQKGDVMFYRTQHTGFIYSPYDGRTVITLEGNADVYATADEAERSSTGSGDFEGIGYKKRYLSDDFRIYRPPYSAESSTTVNMVGVDVSYWNGYNVDWEKAKAAGIDFALAFTLVTTGFLMRLRQKKPGKKLIFAVMRLSVSVLLLICPSATITSTIRWRKPRLKKAS